MKNIINQFKEFIISLSTLLTSGYSVQNALGECLKEMNYLFGESSQISKYLRSMNRKIRLNVPIEDIMEDFAEDTGIEDIKTFAQMFGVAKKTGGSINQVIGVTASNIREKLDVEREIDMIINGKKYEQRVMMCVPIFIIIYMRLSAPESMQILYDNWIGTLIMSICLIGYIASVALADKITRIEV